MNSYEKLHSAVSALRDEIVAANERCVMGSELPHDLRMPPQQAKILVQRLMDALSIETGLGKSGNQLTELRVARARVEQLASTSAALLYMMSSATLRDLLFTAFDFGYGCDPKVCARCGEPLEKEK